MKLYKDLTPTVSIILPTYNRASFIERAITSVIKQSTNDWELIIVDDGSLDNTFQICNKFLLENSHIRYIKQSHRKLPLSLNTGIRAACGKFVCFLGSDDEFLPNHLKFRLDHFKKNKSVELVHGGVKIIGNEFVKDKNNLDKLIHLNNCVIGGTFFGRKRVFELLGGFKNIEYSEDSDFYERAKLAKVKIEKVNAPTYVYYRNTENSICNSI